ncbi:hypothetical protein ACQBAR_01865 [Propionibacteriaceae bacterium Y1685]|uniref:hypothetical protein n=1 Tax=Microlunatus sp. Y1700 TaxID=3418487 RepID=UPI003B7B5FB5
MDDFTIVAIALGVGVPLIFALVIGIILFAGKARPQSGLGPRSDAAGAQGAPGVHGVPGAGVPGAAVPGAQGTSGVWNAMILSGPFASLGGTLGATTGRFHVQQGNLAFVPDGHAEPAWTVPCPQIAARAYSAFSTRGVDLFLPDQQLRCNVSREHINRFSRNSIKSLREPMYYREFVGVLVANGARPV